MEVLVIIMFVLAVAGLGFACYALGNVNGYIKGYEDSCDYAMNAIKEARNK